MIPYCETKNIKAQGIPELGNPLGFVQFSNRARMQSNAVRTDALGIFLCLVCGILAFDFSFV